MKNIALLVLLAAIALGGSRRGSLLPAKVDPLSGEEFPGDYEFNPYTGKKLSTN